MYFFKTDKGLVREKNEDSVDIFESGNAVFMCVLDGMGGHNRGDTASSLALKVIKDKLQNKKKYHTLGGLKQAIVHAIRKANKVVNDLGNELIEYSDMGTTLILVAFYKNKYILCNIGDSRCYIVNEDKISQLSEDQTYVAFLYKTGKITFDEMKTHPKRHVLMNALGTYPSVTMTIKIYKRNVNKILLCSDGLYNMVSNEEIQDIITRSDRIDNKVDALINLANEHGGKDNVAVALWEED